MPTRTELTDALIALIPDDGSRITNAELKAALEPEALKGEHASRPRNLLIADVFFRRGLIERWGRGTQVIVEECQRAGRPEPSYSLKGGCFVVTFPVGAGSEPESRPESRPESGPESDLARGVLQALQDGPLGKAEIAKALAIAPSPQASTAPSGSCFPLARLRSHCRRNRTAACRSIS